MGLQNERARYGFFRGGFPENTRGLDPGSKTQSSRCYLGRRKSTPCDSGSGVSHHYSADHQPTAANPKLNQVDIPYPFCKRINTESAPESSIRDYIRKSSPIFFPRIFPAMSMLAARRIMMKTPRVEASGKPSRIRLTRA